MKPFKGVKDAIEYAVLAIGRREDHYPLKPMSSQRLFQLLAEASRDIANVKISMPDIHQLPSRRGPIYALQTMGGRLQDTIYLDFTSGESRQTLAISHNWYLSPDGMNRFLDIQFLSDSPITAETNASLAQLTIALLKRACEHNEMVLAHQGK